MEEPLAVCQCPCHCRGLPLRVAMSIKVASILFISNQLGLILLGLLNIELGNRNSSNLVQQPGILPTGKLLIALLLGLNLGGVALRQGSDGTPSLQYL